MPYLSHSQCETISQCPRRWYLQKAEGAPQAPSEALILGAAVHTCLEHAGTAIMEGQTPPTLDDLIDDFADALTIAIADDDPQHMLSVPTLSDMRAKGIAILRAYVEHLQPRYAPTAVEESFTVEIPGAPGWKFTAGYSRFQDRGKAVATRSRRREAASKRVYLGHEPARQ